MKNHMLDNVNKIFGNILKYTFLNVVNLSSINKFHLRLYLLVKSCLVTSSENTLMGDPIFHGFWIDSLPLGCIGDAKYHFH